MTAGRGNRAGLMMVNDMDLPLGRTTTSGRRIFRHRSVLDRKIKT
jgi:hypothetical protein